MNEKLTVFTPAYNRAHTLINSYQALCDQTNKSFIWMIVDDGSTDNTKELVDKWINENKIIIQYIYQENAGKQRAVNTGVVNCKTPYFGFLDSDDYYCKNTVQNFIDAFATIDSNRVAGILARRGINEVTPMGSTNIPDGKYVMNFDRLIKKYNYTGDTCRAYFTDILKDYLYPIISDKFIPEDVMLSAIDQDYDLLIVNKVFSISGYLKDGYTNNGHALFLKNKYGFALGMAQIAISRRGILRRVKYTIMFTVWCKHFKIKNFSSLIRRKILFYLLMPFSYIALFAKWPRWYFEENDGKK